MYIYKMGQGMDYMYWYFKTVILKLRDKKENALHDFF